MTLHLKLGVRVDYLDDEALILDRSGSVVHLLKGDSAEALRLAAAGVDEAEVPERL